MLNVDLPYLEPLLFFLREDESLKSFFTKKSFFMPKSDLIEAIDKAINSDCPAPRSLWILPQDTSATISNPRNCMSPGLHTFLIQIIVQCIRDPFTIKKNEDDSLYLDGQFMVLSEIRKAVKKSVVKFSKEKHEGFSDLHWRSERMLYPEDGQNFLITSLEYQVKIYQ